MPQLPLPTLHYNHALVIVSLLISMAAAYVALSLEARMRSAATPLRRRLWLAAGSVSKGVGIWSMHYLGMLAVDIGVPVYYHWPTVLLSWALAVAASLASLQTISRTALEPRRLFFGALLMAAGIGGMHYTGMAAMRSTAMEHDNYWLVALSILSAVGFSWLALWLAFAVRKREHRGAETLRVAAACVIGLAIASMHYIAMAATTFSVSGMPFSMAHTVQIGLLGQYGIAIMAILILVATLATSIVDRERFITLTQANARLEELQGSLLHANELLSALTHLDGLTGLSNRRHLDAMLQAEWERATRKRTTISALMIDIDFFKSLNDRYGHQRGDECLRQVAALLLNRPYRSYDCVARYGGEEFMVLLPETPLTDAILLAQRIGAAVRTLQIENLGAIGDVVTVSIGVASMTPHWPESLHNFVAAADAALYVAKRSGKDRVEACASSASLEDPLHASAAWMPHS